MSKWQIYRLNADNEPTIFASDFILISQYVRRTYYDYKNNNNNNNNEYTDKFKSTIKTDGENHTLHLV